MPYFGGDDLKTLDLTTACYSRSDAELQAYPQSGCIKKANRACSKNSNGLRLVPLTI